MSGLSLDDKSQPQSTDDEKKSILDLFKTGN